MICSIVSDSSCDLRMRDFAGEDILFQTVPLRLLVGEREFADNDSLDIRELLGAMSLEKSAASTACPSPGAFAQAFEKADRTVCFTISANLSGTYNAALMGRDIVLGDHPEKEICVIDSKATAGAMILLIRRARELLTAGGGFEDICSQLRLYQAALRTCFTLENFDNLIKNGRMRPLVGTLLHSLGIHVIADATPQGTIHVAGKARGETKTYQAITALMRDSKDCTGAEVIICHCENPGGAMLLRDRILTDLPVKGVELVPCRGLTTFYAMEKGLIISY
ncbi:DegV family protein [Oscillospiraceae bacterium 38-13]